MRTVKNLIDLTGRTALITGGAGHIGRAIGGALAELGARVAVLDRRADLSASAVAELDGKWNRGGLALAADLSKESDVRAAANRAVETFGGLDILVHAAALVGDTPLEGWVTPFEQQSSATWRLALEVNLTSFFVLAQTCAPALRATGRGSIVAVSSIYGSVAPDLGLYGGTGMGSPAAYAASKGGLVAHARWLSTVLAPEVRVNVLSPGGIFRNQPADFVKRYEARTPMKRMGTEEDLVGAAVYLASDLSLYATGQNIFVDGGWTAW